MSTDGTDSADSTESPDSIHSADTSSPGDAPLVPVHPEAVPGDAATVRWVTRTTMPFAGPVAFAGRALGALLAAGVVRRVEAQPDALEVTLADAADWRRRAENLRSAVQQALADTASWRPAARDQLGDDALLAAAARRVVAGPAGDYVRSHGGRIEILSARDDAVVLQMSGTCAGCPALGVTLDDRLEREIRALYPRLASLRAEVDRSRPRVPLLRLGRHRG